MDSTKSAARRGKRNRQKGAEAEREVVKRLLDAGISAEKISRSGYTGHDIEAFGARPAECKRRAKGWPTLRKWLDGVSVLFLRADGNKEFLVCMELSVLIEIVEDAANGKLCGKPRSSGANGRVE